MVQHVSSWPPLIGDRVGIKGCRLVGLVTGILDEGGERRFILKVEAPADLDAGSAYELTQAAQVARATYLVGEIEPRAELH